MIEKLAVGALAVGIVAGIASWTVAEAFAQTDVISARKDNRKESNRALRAVKKIVDDKGNPADAVPIALKMIELEKQLAAMFPAGSGTGDTKARPTIWTDWTGFQSASTDMVAAAAGIAEAGKGGDAARLATALDAAANTCSACHQKFVFD